MLEINFVGKNPNPQTLFYNHNVETAILLIHCIYYILKHIVHITVPLHLRVLTHKSQINDFVMNGAMLSREREQKLYLETMLPV